MKIKYRRFDDNDYTEVECDDFVFKSYDYKTFLYLNFRNKHNESVVHNYHNLKIIENVCEVYLEEI